MGTMWPSDPFAESMRWETTRVGTKLMGDKYSVKHMNLID